MPFFSAFLSRSLCSLGALFFFFFFFALVLLTSSACFGLWPWSVAVLLEPLELIRSRRCSFDI